ncbi:MAG: hypothetical protein M3227_05585 [Thermoproteota archaeon]|jgi:hypothetical protein|nr:hypothetical protein [Thermoproteota archaeon]MDQ3971139.1 hypothetical protein [Thermoproteota archaeon]
MIRHCVEESNVDSDMTVIDPTKIRHVTIAGGRIALVSGLIDPASHLNLDFPDHRVTICVIAERFEVGAKVMMDSDGLVFATVPRALYGHYGYLDYTQRLVDMIKAFKTNQEQRKQEREGTARSTKES